MASPGDTEAEQLRAQVASLEEQLRRVVLTEQRLYYAQRDVSRQLQRVQALNDFSIRWPQCANGAEILGLACRSLLSLFVYDQGAGFLCGPDGRVTANATEEGRGRGGGSGRAIPGTPVGTVQDIPPELTLIDRAAPRPGLQESPWLGALQGMLRPDPAPVEPLSLLAIPLREGDGGRCHGLLIFRRQGPVGFHESVAAEVDRPFLELIGRHVATALSQLRLVEDLRRSCQELEQAQDEAVKRERLAALGELAAVVAHEVRNPVAVIFNSVGGLRRLLPPDAEAKGLLGVVAEEASRLEEMVAELLDFARPSMRERRPERMEQIVADATERARRAGRDNAGRIRIEQEPNLPAVWGDARMLQQAVLNLLTNSLEAGGAADPVVVRLGCERTGQNVQVRLEVQDQGCGISAENLQRIFEPFFTTRATGTGLGLAVVKKVVDAHGGVVQVRSSPGAGSTFTVLLPVTELAAR